MASAKRTAPKEQMLGAQATLNVRLSPTLKQHGLEVLEQAGVSVTEAVRALFEYLEENRELPECLQAGADKDNNVFERRRATMLQMIGILPPDASLAQAREARLARHGL